MRASILCLVLAAMMLSLPGGSDVQAETKTVIKVATMQPRTSQAVLQSKKFNKELAET